MIQLILQIVGGIAIYYAMFRFSMFMLNKWYDDEFDYEFDVGELSNFEIFMLTPFITPPILLAAIIYYLTYPVWKPIQKFKELEYRINKLEKRKNKK